MRTPLLGLTLLISSLAVPPVFGQVTISIESTNEDLAYEKELRQYFRDQWRDVEQTIAISRAIQAQQRQETPRRQPRVPPTPIPPEWEINPMYRAPIPPPPMTPMPTPFNPTYLRTPRGEIYMTY